MPTEEWIAERYPPNFMADMLADVVGDFTDVQAHPAIAAARHDQKQIAELADHLGTILRRLVQDGTVVVTVYANASMVTDRDGEQHGCLLGDFTVGQVATLLHLAPAPIGDQRDTAAPFTEH
ncbi:hypothetical protein [Paractinoplanes toevensis]|uniref:Uncharacterized protein n=1 Tax=Paractinoplanes toevensis TaxID=571911 RepID=A0A919T9E3_9ACTN|nr:hypothetical protein [Actinoplanes toevensis]GIM90119.1 hypothetical protein Ato02nite_019120 [Actinoplanes toevensis]